MDSSRSFDALPETLSEIRAFVEAAVPTASRIEPWKASLCAHELAAHLIVNGASHVTVRVDVGSHLKIGVRDSGRTVAEKAALEVFDEDSPARQVFDRLTVDNGWTPADAELWVELDVGASPVEG